MIGTKAPSLETLTAVDDANMDATPALLPVGGEYRASATTYTDGDATVIQTNKFGHTRITDNGCTCTTVDLATDADVVVTASPAQLLGVYVLVAMSAHAAIIKNSSTAVINLPASLAAGTQINCHGANFATNITVESDNAGTGTLLIFWRAA